MKLKSIIVSLVIMFIMFGSVNEMHAQKRVRNYIHSITANPIALAFGVLNVTYEQQIGPKNSFTGFGSYWSFGDWTAIGIGGSYRWYIMADQANPIQGLSAGPLAAIGFWDYDTDTYEGSTSLAIGGEVAYKWVFDGGFSIEPIAQISFNLLDIEGLSYRPVSIGVNLGYAW